MKDIIRWTTTAWTFFFKNLLISQPPHPGLQLPYCDELNDDDEDEKERKESKVQDTICQSTEMNHHIKQLPGVTALQLMLQPDLVLLPSVMKKMSTLLLLLVTIGRGK